MERIAQPRINAIGTAVPRSDVHGVYAGWARQQLADPREQALFERMLARGGIEHRWSVLADGDATLAEGSFYRRNASPGTAERMRRYAQAAPDLALQAIAELPGLDGVTHLIVASCTGFMAPGLDQVIARRLGLPGNVERLSIGFMGCYAGITLLRTAAQVVRAVPQAKVLAVAVELSTLHLQESDSLEALLAMGQFADGAAAALVSAEGAGLALGQAISATLDDSADLITWTVTDTGFAMHLSGEVPGRLAEAFAAADLRASLHLGDPPPAMAVHPGGKSILDAVERGLDLPHEALAASRHVLANCGNMSSVSVIFVLKEMFANHPSDGIALAFGPGLAMEGLRFGWVNGDA
ncbi:MAG: type III polyketide synthase [Erythrobacter sp.]|nr:type III polyketide synthase [Erythrobacter sp.]